MVYLTGTLLPGRCLGTIATIIALELSPHICAFFQANNLCNANPLTPEQLSAHRIWEWMAAHAVYCSCEIKMQTGKRGYKIQAECVQSAIGK